MLKLTKIVILFLLLKRKTFLTIHMKLDTGTNTLSIQHACMLYHPYLHLCSPFALAAGSVRSVVGVGDTATSVLVVVGAAAVTVVSVGTVEEEAVAVVVSMGAIERVVVVVVVTVVVVTSEVAMAVVVVVVVVVEGVGFALVVVNTRPVVLTVVVEVDTRFVLTVITIVLILLARLDFMVVTIVAGLSVTLGSIIDVGSNVISTILASRELEFIITDVGFGSSLLVVAVTVGLMVEVVEVVSSESTILVITSGPSPHLLAAVTRIV